MTAEAADSSLRYFAHGEVRDSQAEMVEDGFEALLSEGFLMASAPTGIGTVSYTHLTLPTKA